MSPFPEDILKDIYYCWYTYGPYIQLPFWLSYYSKKKKTTTKKMRKENKIHVTPLELSWVEEWPK